MRMRPLPAALALTSTAVGAAVLVVVGAFVAIPLLLGVALLGAWIVVTLLLGWAGIELMAALERWLENDERFVR